MAFSGTLRQRLIGYLGQAVIEATQLGDLEAARVANEAIAKLLGTQDPNRADHAEVVDRSTRRKDR